MVTPACLSMYKYIKKESFGKTFLINFFVLEANSNDFKSHKCIFITNIVAIIFI